MPILLFLFIAIPIIEIALFIQAGELIGLWPTIGTVIVTAMVGTYLVRKQGRETWARAQRDLAEGRAPVKDILTGICLLLSGALLLTPGFLTDALGLLLLTPAFRVLLGAWVVKNILSKARMRSHSFHAGSHGAFHSHGSSDFAEDQNPHQPRPRPHNHNDKDASSAHVKSNVIDVDYDDK